MPITVLGACPHDCPDTCALQTTVQDGIAIKVQGNPQHAQTGGALCTKVSRYTERVYHPQRILQPLKRVGAKGSGQFAPVSWQEALSAIAAKLSAICAHDPQAVLPYSYAGTMGKVQGEAMSERFFNRMGASQLDRTICAAAGGAALGYTLGVKTGMRVQNFAKSDLILIWGGNPITSSVHFWRYAQEAKRQGARIICIDPRKSETADKCHQHIAILPGTDAALAFGIMHQLITHDWLDHDYIAQHTLGWDQLRERALQWPPARVAQVCGISEKEVVDLAQAYGTAKRAAIRLNYGMQRVHGGGNAVRAVLCLPALIGAWRYPESGLLLSASGSSKANSDALCRPDLRAQYHPNQQPRTINMIALGDALNQAASATFGPQVQALVVYNSNPAAVAPDGASVRKGLLREDLFTVVLEHFQTDTADYADYILPATTQLEHWDIHSSYGHTDILLNQPAIAPQGQARSNAQIFRDLAQHMGYTDACFADDDRTLCEQAYAGKVDFDQLLAQGYVQVPVSDAPFAQGAFGTPSGKCEFFSQTLADMGADGLPDYVPNYNQPSAQYPLRMISPPPRNYLNSTFVNVDSLRATEPQPVLELHPQDAQARGIAQGDVVEVYNDLGTYRCVAQLNSRARAGVVNGLGVWWHKLSLDGHNANALTTQRTTDMGNGPVFYDCVVEVRKLAQLGN